MAEISFETITSLYGMHETGSRQVVYSSDRAARQGLSGTEIDGLFGDIRQISRDNPYVLPIETEIPALLDEHWAGVQGLVAFANSQLSPQRIVTDLAPKHMEQDASGIPRRAGRLAFARALAEALVPRSVSPTPGLHELFNAETRISLAAKLEIVQAITSGINGSPRYHLSAANDAMKRHGVGRGTISRIGTSELNPQWVLGAWRQERQHEIRIAAGIILNSREIARSIVRAGLQLRVNRPR